MGKITDRVNQLNPIFQNLILGLITGVCVGYVVKFFFQRFGASGIILAAFVAIGALIGYLSGRERLRLEKMKLEKAILEEDMDKIQTTYKQAINKYRFLFDNISDPIFVTTEDGRFLLFNEATCMMSGYTREELKSMRINAFQMDETPADDQRKAWLDNGIYRYEERWKDKSGAALDLDINSKWLKLAQNRYILYVARSIQHRMGAQEDRFQELRRLNEKKVDEMSRYNQALLRQIATPFGNAFGLFRHLSQTCSSETKKINETVAEWDKLKRLLQILSAKTTRDLRQEETDWDINDVVRQELHYLETLAGDQNIMVNTRFAFELPTVRTSGKLLSTVFGALFQSSVKSLQRAQKKQMTVATRAEGKSIKIDVNIPEGEGFEKHLTETLDPIAGGDAPDTGILWIGVLLDLFKGKLDVEHPQSGGTALHITLQGLKVPRSG